MYDVWLAKGSYILCYSELALRFQSFPMSAGDIHHVTGFAARCARRIEALSHWRCHFCSTAKPEGSHGKQASEGNLIFWVYPITSTRGPGDDG